MLSLKAAARAAAHLLLALTWLCLLFASKAQAYEVIDSLGQRLQFERPPQRIVSLLPSLTESVCVLQACERLVGVDRYSNWPASVESLPKVGGGLDPNIEMIVALQPDLVLLGTSSRASEQLKALGLKVAALEPKTHADVRTVLGKVGQILGQPTFYTYQIWTGIERDINQAAAEIPPQLRGQTVYFEASPGPYAAGASSFIGETLTRLGLKNIVPASLGPFPKLNPEYVVSKDPDLIMAGDSATQDMLAYPGWRRMRAVRKQRVCQFSLAERDVLVRAGPRMGEAAKIMQRCIVGRTKPAVSTNSKPKQSLQNK